MLLLLQGPRVTSERVKARNGLVRIDLGSIMKIYEAVSLSRVHGHIQSFACGNTNIDNARRSLIGFIAWLLPEFVLVKCFLPSVLPDDASQILSLNSRIILPHIERKRLRLKMEVLLIQLDRIDMLVIKSV